MKQIRLALVGGGFIAGAHAAAWRVLSLFFPELPRLRRLVVCEVDEERARSAASRLDFEEWEIGWEKAVRRTDVDLVAIATPPGLHRDVALAAIGAGKHVFCEKPLARFAAEAEEMCRAAEKAGVVNVVGFNLRRAPAIQQAAKMARDGSLGEVLHVSGRYFQDHGRDPSRPSSWRYDSARAGSGAIGDLGSHCSTSGSRSRERSPRSSPSPARCTASAARANEPLARTWTTARPGSRASSRARPAPSR